MQSLLIRILMSGSLLLLYPGCRVQPYAGLTIQVPMDKCMDRFVVNYTTELYQAAINISGRHISGLLYFKNMGDSATRVVFTSETGITFFDFEFADPGFRVVKIIDKLDRKPVISTLKKDIGLIIRHNLKGMPHAYMQDDHYFYYGYRSGTETNWYITNQECSKLLRIESATKKKKKVAVELFGYGPSLPDSVFINHPGFKFNITLNKIVP